MNIFSVTKPQLSTIDVPIETAPEIELILCCARTRLEPATKERIEFLLRQNINWTYFIQIATEHGVIPLIYQSLKATEPKAVPEKTFSELRFHSQGNELRNYYLFEKLIKILDLLKAEGISAVPFKGPLLSITAYNKLSLRQFSDLDILVKKDDFLKAKNILLQLDFKPIVKLKMLNSQEEQAYLQEIDEFTLVRAKESIEVVCDLHQAITVSHFRKCKIEFFKIKDKLTYISFQGNKINTIKPDYLLILLCIHASRHFWCQLNWICDVNELINSCEEINWLEILNEATSLGCRHHLLLGLALSNSYFETTIAKEIQTIMQKSLRVKYLSRYIQKAIFDPSETKPNQGFNLSNFVYQMLLTNSWRGYKEIINYFIFPSRKDKLIFDLPSQFNFLYYFLRPVRLFSQLIARKNHN